MRTRLLIAAILVWTCASTALAADTALLSSGDREFVQMAVDSNSRELQLSLRAKEKAQSDAVRNFAALMVDEHGPKGKELAAASQRMAESGGPPFKRQDQSARDVVIELNTLEGGKFDRRYMEVMVKDHEDAIRLYERESKVGKDPQLKALAQKTLPDLRRHLQMAKAIAADMK